MVWYSKAGPITMEGMGFKPTFRAGTQFRQIRFTVFAPSPTSLDAGRLLVWVNGLLELADTLESLPKPQHALERTRFETLADNPAAGRRLAWILVVGIIAFVLIAYWAGFAAMGYFK